LYTTTFDLTGGSDWCQVYGDLIYADNHCNAKVVNSPCVSATPLDLQCPAGNGVLYRAPEVSTYHPRVLCKVCKIMSIPEDTDLGMGTYSGTFTFGPNQIDNVLDETYIKAYKVYFANSNLTKMGGTAAATITVSSPVAISTCGCTGNEHSVTLSMVDIPSGATGFMIVVVDSYDMEMPVGTYVGGLMDKWTTTTTTTTTSSVTTTTTKTSTTTITTTTTSTVTIKPVVSFALGRRMSAMLVWLATAAAAVVVVTA